MMTHRLFLALPLPQFYLDQLGELREKYNFRGVRWTAKHNLHITALFLGDTKEDQINDLSDALNQLKNINSFKLNFKGLALAPPNRPPRMIWANFEESKAFDVLVRRCFEACKTFCRINPPYRQIPHITLARFKDYVDYRQIRLPEITLNPLLVQEIKLVESVLTPQGPIYDGIERIKLKKDNEN